MTTRPTRESRTLLVMLAFLASAAVATTACNRGKDKAGTGEASCDDAGKAFLAMAKQDLAEASDVPETTRAGLLQMLIPVRDEFVAKCVEEKWPAKARACIVAATTDEAYRACEAELPPEVRTRLGTGRPVAPPSGTDAPPAPSGDTPSPGTETPSAGSGSGAQPAATPTPTP